MVKIKNVKITLPVEGKKSYKDILELLSGEDVHEPEPIERTERVREVFKEYQVEGTVVYPAYVVMREGTDEDLKLYSAKFSITPDGCVDNEFELVPEWNIKKDLLEEIKQRFQKMIEKYPRLSYGDVDLGILMGIVAFGEVPEVRKPGDLLMFTNTDDIAETIGMTVEEYNEYLKRQKEKQLLEQEVEREKAAVQWVHDEQLKEREKCRSVVDEQDEEKRKLARKYFDEEVDKEKKAVDWFYEQKQKEREKLERKQENVEK